MKEIPNKTISLLNEKNEPGTIIDLLKIALDCPPQQTGFNRAVIRARARVDAVIEGVGPGGVMKFEDADFETAKSAVDTCPFARIPRKDIAALYDAFGL